MISDIAKLSKALFYADHIKELSIRKSSREEEINHLRGEMGLSVGAIGDKVCISPSADAIPNAVIKLQDLIAEYAEDLAEYVDEIRVFVNCLDRIDRTQAQALFARYVRLLLWKQVANQMGYSEQRIYQLREEGLIALYDVMPEYWRREIIPDAED